MKSGISLRITLTLLNAALAAVLLIVAAILLYASLRQTMLRLVDVTLEEALLAAVEEVEYHDGLPGFDREWDRDPDETGFYRVSLFDGRVVAAWITSLDGDVLDSRDDWDGPFWSTTRTVEEGTLWRVNSRPLLDEKDVQVAWIHTAQPIIFVQDTLRRMTGILIAGLSLILLLSAGIGWLLTGRALQPLMNIAATASAIDGTNLQYRSGYHGPVSEIAELSASFDLMLKRLEDVIERERRLTADAAHELRTPLTALKGQIDVALSRERSPYEYSVSSKFTRVIGRSSFKGTWITSSGFSQTCSTMCEVFSGRRAD